MPELAEGATSFGVHAYAGIPLWVGEQFYGTLCFLAEEAVGRGKIFPG